jgi:hypothetical protein
MILFRSRHVILLKGTFGIDNCDVLRPTPVLKNGMSAKFGTSGSSADEICVSVRFF